MNMSPPFFATLFIFLSVPGIGTFISPGSLGSFVPGHEVIPDSELGNDDEPYDEPPGRYIARRLMLVFIVGSAVLFLVFLIIIGTVIAWLLRYNKDRPGIKAGGDADYWKELQVQRELMGRKY